MEMNLVPDGYVDSMPCDPVLLPELGRVCWAAARLHFGVRDAINRYEYRGDEPFEPTLGGALSQLEKHAARHGRVDHLEWIRDYGRPAVEMRNKVVHAVTYTAEDGRQAIRSNGGPLAGRLQIPELRSVTRALITASSRLPSG